ncbi:MAG: glycoside hydrolase family 99-like domain-containing protein [Christensenellaceae bacterium]
MKVMAMYLPQFHETAENSRWWGNGYTEWSAVMGAKKLVNLQNQPRVPLHKNYYDLADENAAALKWQARLANENGIYGFVFYHYWFSKNCRILEKPMEILLRHPEIDIHYSICWANESWTKTWYGLETEVLMEQIYGDESEWREHFGYLLKFFMDERYEKINNKPVVHIHRSSSIDHFDKMLYCWNKMAKSNGFAGIYIVSANTGGQIDERTDLIDAYYNFEPTYTLKHNMPAVSRKMTDISIAARTMYNKYFNKECLERIIPIDRIYNAISLKIENRGKPIYLGTFPMWDNTPRRSYKGTVFIGNTPEKFEKSLKRIINATKTDGYVYINAWNEWGESCYLEPDTCNEFRYLYAVKKCVEENCNNE